MASLIKQREILFHAPHPDPNQAGSAREALAPVDGVEDALASSPLRLEVTYDLTLIGLAEIDGALIDLGYHLDNSLMSKLKRALFYYTEETQLANLGQTRQRSNDTRDVFINRYHRLPHGCRDERPDHWRNYL